ncbi:hypothetical protein [Agromyces sp. CCNWLW203]|uniref:hypothetical protein n=1 Tax=Agromyces sp. CCNWLW203 TaxID=3112842 RepID=UPI002F9615C3
MFKPRFSAITTGLLAVSTAVVLGSCSAAPAPAEPEPAVPEPAAVELTASRSASFSGVGDVTTIAEFDLAAGQLPENIVNAGRGVAVTFAASGQIAAISPSGEIEVLGTLPAPTGGGSATPVLGFALTTGLAHVDDSYYALYATGEADTTGLWKLDDAGEFDLIAALPADGLPNGLAYDEEHERFLAADSVAGTVYSIDRNGAVETWSDDAGLAQAGFLGANGVQLHRGDLYVSNLDAGTIQRIDIRDDGSAGAVTTAAEDLAGVDDFAFTGRGDQIIATLNPSSEVVLVTGGVRTTVLTAEDGLSNPTSVLVRGDTVYVPSAAYVNQDSPNLLSATLQRD